MAEEQMQKAGQTGSYKLFVVGELGRQYFGHRGIKVAEQFHYTAQNPTLHRARIITETILEQFEEEQLDEVYIIYTNMVNSVTTEPQMLRLLPIVKERFITKDGQDLSMYQDPLVMTPSPKAVLDNIVPDFVMGYVYGALVESFCSEQNARMMAMEAANKNASTMIHDLSIQYNRVRQAMITQEITEVIAGAKAQKKEEKGKKGGPEQLSNVKEKNHGKIVQVMGPVVDVEFENNDLPFIKDALEVYSEGKRLVMEVAQHIGNNTVRCIMLWVPVKDFARIWMSLLPERNSGAGR